MIVIETFSGDDAPDITFNISREDGSVVDLTGAKVWMIIQDPDTGLTTNNPTGSRTNQCTITNATQGQCIYSWNAGGTDLPDPGIYKANLKIKYATNHIETYGMRISAGYPIAQIS